MLRPEASVVSCRVVDSHVNTINTIVLMLMMGGNVINAGSRATSIRYRPAQSK